MKYIPNNETIRRRMLDDVGLPGVEELFSVIPEDCRLSRKLDLPEPMDEISLSRHMNALAGNNRGADKSTCLLGGGAYHHFIPAVVGHVTSRSEFYTAYTPYQPEISQGTLQAIFEYQSMMCQLTAMDVSNASMYDGASAAAEAVLMARRFSGRNKVVLSAALNPLYRQVIRTYLRFMPGDIVEVPWQADGRMDMEAARRAAGDEAACLVVQNPNFFGVIEDGAALAEWRRVSSSLLVAVVAEPLSLGLLEPPGEWGADIVAAEGQSLGNPVGFGGPSLGVLTARRDYIRQMPGRLVGQTTDSDGRRGYVLTLATREQHIRREKATSNICSNEGLCALAAAVYLASLGDEGLRQVAARNVLQARKAMTGLAAIGNWRFPFSGPVFNEFAAVPPGGAERFQKALMKTGFSGGIRLNRWYPKLRQAVLFCFTEMVSDVEVERFLETARRSAS